MKKSVTHPLNFILYPVQNINGLTVNAKTVEKFPSLPSIFSCLMFHKRINVACPRMSDKRNMIIIFFLGENTRFNCGFILACSRLSISGSERKQRRAKNQAIQGERAGARGLWEGVVLPSQTLLIFFLARPPLVVRTH